MQFLAFLLSFLLLPFSPKKQMFSPARPPKQHTKGPFVALTSISNHATVGGFRMPDFSDCAALSASSLPACIMAQNSS